jgi:hypothetical protein
MENTSNDAPGEFVCPISLQIMKDPVMSKSGQNYDRDAILQWLNRGNVNCPLTRQPLKPSLLAPNNSLKRKIMKWKFYNGVEENDDDDVSVSSNQDYKGFVGLIDVDCNGIDGSSSSSTPEPSAPTSSGNHYADDELSDLLDLYNEVLALTDSPMNATIPQGASSQAEQDDLDTMLSQNGLLKVKSRRGWRPKMFSKKITKQ